MGLSWQQGPRGRNPNGTFLTTSPMPERVLYLEPLRRRAEIGGIQHVEDPVIAEA